ncbi:uncharacterized protein N7473_001984 [Penicillium subrubescens]|uniref:Uncharacterized protein n=1 Tax=Penicillium subrubescens TaxID=1316194 RepID=A0A1Q5SQK6_9EURO|nr:uncharacterized protein N7473_001984 [Penicillium subrubescens]KAJ5905068.1 hypothetical protein N7473_001984 [Penicillium subrubescens]OKO90277.1 hypothetical protein PENSUB_13410 [Penicillium subrubescens]
MNSPVPTTASQRVLSSPELVASIIDWLVVDSYARPEQNQSSRLPILLRDRQTLIQCACVNVTLWTQVMRRFWLHVPDIALQLSIIDPARCQLYADLIQTGNLIQIKRGLKKARAALSGVTFPRLHVLKLVLRLRDPDFKFPVSLPRFCVQW